MTKVNRVEPPMVNLPEHFDKVYKTFNSYNKDTDSSLVITFCEVSDLYGLDEVETEFNWLLGQILLESGGRQYINDDLVVSSTGAIGIGQILRSTSLLYLKKCISKEDSAIFRKVGVTDYSFVNDESCNRRERIALAKEWLSNETNNIALWGKIMSDELRYKTMVDALISYNVGPRKLKEYLDSGCTRNSHHYIVGIKSRLRYVK